MPAMGHAGPGEGDRMIRRLFTATSAGSLLLCIVAVGLWVRSYWGADMLQGDITSGGRVLRAEYNTFAWRGELSVWVGVLSEPFEIEDRHRGVYSRIPRQYPGPSAAATTLGFAYVRQFGEIDWIGGHEGHRLNYGLAYGSGQFIRGDCYTFIVPLWFIAVLTALLPAQWAFRRWRARCALREGRCRVCGYDLRASPGRCPECGTAIAGTKDST